NTGKSLSQRGWDIPTDKTVKRRAVSEVVPGAQARPQPKSTFYKEPAPAPTPIKKEKVIKGTGTTPGTSRTQATAEQTRRQAGQAQAAAEAAKKAPPTPQKVRSGWAEREFGAPGMKMPPPSAYQGAGLVPRSSGEVAVRGATKRGPAAAAPTPSAKAALKPEQASPAARSGGPPPPLKFTNPFDSLKRAPTPKTPAATVGRSAKRPQPAPKSEVSGATGAAFREEAKRIPAARQLATSGKPLPSGSPSAMETVRGGREAATVRPAKTQEAINRVRAGEQTADDLARVGVKPNLRQRLSQTKDRAEAGVRKKIDARASAKRQQRQESAAVAARKAQVTKVKGELKQVDSEIRAAIASGNNQAMSQLAGKKQILERELKQMGASAPRARKPVAQQPAAQQPVAQQPTAPAELANRKPPPAAPTAPAQAPATPVQQAASQSPGFWQQAKNTWSGMSDNQRLLAVGVGGVGAGMVTSPKKQPAPPMYGPAPQYYQMAPQPPAFR
ncbi:MAG: hypothetical protein VXZ72_00745, partial [Chlamydiota bacterium]|nr:hypothetical protein [Chlamydiota bacterium]